MTGLHSIENKSDLLTYLKTAMVLEHATLPPYLTALYSLKPGSNLDAYHILRTVAVEEMLHLTLVANVFNAIGGCIEGVFTSPDFVPTYPTFLPTGETDFEVHIESFSRDSLNTFLNIERPEKIPEEEAVRQSPRFTLENKRSYLLNFTCGDQEVTYYSIGEFYDAIMAGIEKVNQQEANLFSGDTLWQVGPEYYYNGSGKIVEVTGLDSALDALEMIKEQGEGAQPDTIYDTENEICHYYRFEQLILGQYYHVDRNNSDNTDKPGYPTGERLEVDWDEVYPILKNASLSDYPENSELHTKACAFQTLYGEFLRKLEHAFSGSPAALVPAVHTMFEIRELATQIIRNPIQDESGKHGTPIFTQQQ